MLLSHVCFVHLNFYLFIYIYTLEELMSRELYDIEILFKLKQGQECPWEGQGGLIGSHRQSQARLPSQTKLIGGQAFGVYWGV